MNNNDLAKLAQKMIADTLKIDRESHLWIKYHGSSSLPLANACKNVAETLGAASIIFKDQGRLAIRDEIDKSLNTGNPIVTLKENAAYRLEQMKRMTHYLEIDEHANITRASLTEEERQLWIELYSPVNKQRLEGTRWLIVDAPTKEFAQSCGMSQRDADTFFLDACLADYKSMADRIEPLKEIMSGRQHFEITGNNTKLTGQFADVVAVPCVGELNLPDGECFTAPLAGSINGHILFEKTQYGGHVFPWVYLEVENGYIVKATSATAELTIALNSILNTDEGSRQFGEWAIGFNPMITKIIGNVLFDEKVSGTMHMAVGRCIGQTPNGISSKIHWDLVKDQREQAGGGDIIIDGELIRRNGLFIPECLRPLNPESLILN